MGKREQAREEAAFLRGDVGVDGASAEEQQDEAELERGEAREQLLRNRAYLGRELLTWLLWRSESTDALVEYEGAGITPLFVGRVTLRGVTGEVTELVAKGQLSPYSQQVRRALDAGLLVHTARLRLTHGEKVYELTLDAEHLDIRSARLPELLTEDEDDRSAERLDLTEQLSALVDQLVRAFLAERASKSWSKRVVPELKAWLSGAEPRESAPTKKKSVGA